MLSKALVSPKNHSGDNTNIVPFWAIITAKPFVIMITIFCFCAVIACLVCHSTFDCNFLSSADLCISAWSDSWLPCNGSPHQSPTVFDSGDCLSFKGNVVDPDTLACWTIALACWMGWSAHLRFSLALVHLGSCSLCGKNVLSDHLAACSRWTDWSAHLRCFILLVCLVSCSSCRKNGLLKHDSACSWVAF